MSGRPPARRESVGSDVSGGAEVYDVTRHSSYGSVLGIEGHPPPLVLADVVMVALAIVAATSAATGDAWTATLVAVAMAVPFRSWPVLAIAGLLAIGGAWRSADAHHGLVPDELGPFTGWVRLVDDPQPYASST